MQEQERFELVDLGDAKVETQQRAQGALSDSKLSPPKGIQPFP